MLDSRDGVGVCDDSKLEIKAGVDVGMKGKLPC